MDTQKLMRVGKRITPTCLLPLARKCFDRYISCKHKLQGQKYTSKILTYYQDREYDSEIKEVIEYLSKNGLNVFPYEWANSKTIENQKILSSIEVSMDTELNLPYTYLDGKKLYYPKNWSKEGIKGGYFGEQNVAQHPESPHRYLTNEFIVDDGSIIVDCVLQKVILVSLSLRNAKNSISLNQKISG